MLSREDLQNLAEIGLIAASHGDVESAEAIFAALELERPTLAISYIGRAMGQMGAGQVTEAILELDRGLRLASPNEHAEIHLFRGVVLQAAGRASESVRALREAGDMPLALAMLGQPPAAREGA